MPAGRYHFHCTDGEHAVLDRSGKYLRTRDDVHTAAARGRKSGHGELRRPARLVRLDRGRARRPRASRLTLAFNDADMVRQAA